MSFDLMCQLNGLGPLKGFSLLKFENNLVCAPCCHGKMIVAPDSLVNTVIIEQPG
jgi:hypothetical protein